MVGGGLSSWRDLHFILERKPKHINMKWKQHWRNMVFLVILIAFHGRSMCKSSQHIQLWITVASLCSSPSPSLVFFGWNLTRTPPLSRHLSPCTWLKCALFHLCPCGMDFFLTNTIVQKKKQKQKPWACCVHRAIKSDSTFVFPLDTRLWLWIHTWK